MKKLLGFSLLLIAAILLAFQLTSNDTAVEFLDSLNEEQRKKAQMTFDHDSKDSWHFFPGLMYERSGIKFDALNADQRELLHNLLRTYLSETGYNKTLRIMDLENVLIEIKSNVHMRDSEDYHIAFYGDPESDHLWAWSFEGHHVSLNFTILNDKISVAPRFFGASPAIIPSGKRKGERTLALEEDLGLELIQKMSDDMRKKAIISETAYPDIVTGNSSHVEPFEPDGIKLKELNKPLQKTLILLINTYLDNMPEALAKSRMEELKQEKLGDIIFAWAGETVLGKGHYYRIQGKSFLIEFDNTQNNANHIHSVWRDFDGDFGKDLIKEHYEHSHHKNGK
jgi:hypothetical protein